ncbi:beta-ketoacyl synthase N-terminal-like domain-containing protein [Saccharopolyspora sp. NFXS83]|uniref:beta-ketoacyl synthase N-terminal-like domain-containing protein n=1 Tax=Saccharopolyspora sp. NFXS83 TaxID=2993560 RepID=UPI00224A4FC1|nr:beta-ketoacyl synthase N-terminal-like domain-containing protein [Saccharopolyspora sp. NFXS83]MCX2729177.1 beta-ketoacyl synthase N-terminal-like domain-containing protein [Saccharopolyspora sp. NFXS83]
MSRNVRLALPHLAAGGLSENWFLKDAGDLHWELIGEQHDTAVTSLTDDRGERLLPAFVRVRLHAPDSLRAFQEDDEGVLRGRAARLDEHTVVSDVELTSGAHRIEARLMTVFVRRSAGNLLVPGVPVQHPVGAAPEPTAQHREFHHEFRAHGGSPVEPADARFTQVYELNPYVDVNGAGLLYFASYPHVNDHCERAYLHDVLGTGGADWAVDAATVERDLIYLANCGADDSVVYRLDSCRFETGHRFRSRTTLLRESDGAPIARIETVKRIRPDSGFAVLWGDRPAAVNVPETKAVPAGSGDLAGRLLPHLARALDVPAGSFGADDDLRSLGLDSFSLTAFAAEAAAEIGEPVDPSALFQSFTASDLARVLRGERSERPVARTRPRRASADRIAVVGVAGRFPGAETPAKLWELLERGEEAIRDIPADRWDTADHPDAPARAGLLDDIKRFDHAFFRISPREAELMDPQQRLFLEVAWEAFEDAGLDATALEGSRTGVYVGACHTDYADLVRERSSRAEPHSSVGTSPSIIPNRASFFFGFHGPSVAVDTLCSSSLVAVVEAVEALRAGRCDQALVGGVNVICHPGRHEAYARTGALSPRGRCGTFDDEADGYVRGEGVCAVLLKPLDRALADGDPVHAVLRGAAANHGGRAQSLTAPNADAQADLLVDAYERSGVDPATVGYLEAHGTGTRLGDPIEVQGMVRAFERLHRRWGRSAPDSPHCGVGSVKANIGHLEAAAGIAGMIKVILAMRNGTLPATSSARRLNPMIKLDGSPLRVQVERAEWPRIVGVDGAELPRRAGVSSFGMGGSNAHVVLEEPPVRPEGPTSANGAGDPADGPAAPVLVPLSARTPQVLAEVVRNLLRVVLRPDHPSLADIAHTLRTGRASLRSRVVFEVSTVEELAARLRDFTPEDPPVPSPGTAAEWTAGAEVDWAAAGARARRVALPTYPFRRTRHWIEAAPEPESAAGSGNPPRAGLAPAEPRVTIPAAAESRAESEVAASAGPEFIGWSWAPSTPEQGQGPAQGICLVLVPERGLDLPTTVLGAGVRTVRVAVGENAAAMPELPDGEAVTGLIDLVDWPSAAPDAVDEPRISLLSAVLSEHRRTLRTCLHVSGPTRTAVAGFYRMVSAEFAEVRARTVRVDGGPEELAAAVRAEAAIADRETEVRYQGGVRLCPLPRFARPDASAQSPLDDLAGGTVVITGGTGEIGLRLAAELARRGVARLVLIGRRRLPPRTRWASLAGDETVEPRLRRTLSGLLDLIAGDVVVTVRTHELADVPSLRKLFNGVRAASGGISAVFHCAGVMDEPRSLTARSATDRRRVLAPKAGGVHAVWSALGSRLPRLVVLFSSVASALPRLGSGYADYSAANLVLDDFAEQHSAHPDCAVRSLQWPLWRDVGMGRDRGSASAELGIPDLAERDALHLLDAALRVEGHPVLLPCRADRSLVRADELRLAPNREPRSGSARSDGSRSPGHVAAPAAVEPLAEVVARTLKVDPSELRADVAFTDLGVDSLLLAELVAALEDALGEPVDPSLVQEHPTFGEFAAALAERLPARAPDPGPRVQPSGPDGPVPIAIIGMACRFPGSADPEAYWRNLLAGRDLVGEVPADRWDATALYSAAGEPQRSLSKWGGFLADAADFDPEFFGFDETTARQLDPLVRKALEVGTECFRDAGYADDELRGRGVGVFVGSRTGNYHEHLRPLPREAIIGTNQNFIAAHLSHHFDLNGPNMVVDSACSSSLVTVHLAAQSLALGESEMALAGGVDLLLDEEPYLVLSAGKALSPTGRCRTFDEAADGFVPGEGAGMVLLKRLDAAERDGDRVLAVIESSGVNNDGRTMGHTTPSGKAQRALIGEVLRRGRIDPGTIGYVEAHGTGTMIGDPIELQALTAVFREHTAERGFCGIGSVKSNMGHLLSAAGAAGLIKVVQCLRHGVLPPTLHCRTPNPRFEFGRSPFFPVTETTPFGPDGGRARAAVSAFGFGGTNAHLVLRRADQAQARREPLPAPRYRRRRYWFRSATPAAAGIPAAPPRSARLDLHFPEAG